MEFDRKIKDVAEEYIDLKAKKAVIEKQMKDLETGYLVPNAKTVFSYLKGKKVTFVESKTLTKINSEDLFDQLWKEMRTQDIKDHFSITEKATLEFPDGEVLVEKYKENSGISKPSLRVTDLTKAENKLMEEGTLI